ncbi:MAG: hypothetical protein F6K00_17735 [Leptolyngbya sp. SIOISBB]|nr:hypothetical protein [Leptolyngbya sp. SIOISBB]
MTQPKILSRDLLCVMGMFTLMTISVAKASAQAPPLDPGIYSSGYQYLEIAQTGDRICVRGFFDSEAIAETYEDSIAQIRQEANEAIERLESRLAEELIDRRVQLAVLIEDEALLSSAIQDGSIPPDMVDLLDEPAALEQLLTDRAEAAQQQIREFIEQRRIEAEQQLDEFYEAANIIYFQGVASAQLESQSPDTYTIDGTDLRLLPQVNERILFGQNEDLRPYAVGDVALPVDPVLASCLESQNPFIPIQSKEGSTSL